MSVKSTRNRGMQSWSKSDWSIDNTYEMTYGKRLRIPYWTPLMFTLYIQICIDTCTCMQICRSISQRYHFAWTLPHIIVPATTQCHIQPLLVNTMFLFPFLDEISQVYKLVPRVPTLILIICSIRCVEPATLLWKHRFLFFFSFFILPIIWSF